MVNRRNVNSRKRRAAGSFAKQFLVGFLLLMVLVLVGGAVWYGTRLEPFTIVKIEVEGGDTVSHEEVRRVAESELEGNYYNLVPKRFSWSYPEERMESAVKGLEKVKRADVSLEDGQTVHVLIEEYEPAALWCESLVDHGNCILLDSDGYGFTKAPPLVGTAMLRYVNSENPQVGQKPFNREFIRDTVYFAREARQALKLPVFSVEKIGPDEATFYLSGGGQMKLTLRQPVEVSLDNLRVLLSSEDFAHLAPGNFEYIDLRFGDKVFVNEQSGQPDAEVNATSTETVTQ